MSTIRAEQAPPAPPGGATTPKLYMTPHLSKRKDGLCPSLMHDFRMSQIPKEKPGFLQKSYQTNSGLLLQIKDKPGIPRDMMELQTLIEVINKALKIAAKSNAEALLSSLRFKPEGCIWKMEFHPDLGYCHETYRIEVVCHAGDGEHDKTIYCIDTVLIPKKPVDPNPLAPPLPGFQEAKTAFDRIAIVVRKSIVRLEFPEFPEGCKDKQFRDLYQLNARVSDWLRCWSNCRLKYSRGGYL